MPVFFTFLNTRIWWGHAIKQLPQEPPDLICMTLIVMTTDLMIGKCLSFYGLTNFMLKWIWRDSEEKH